MIDYCNKGIILRFQRNRIALIGQGGQQVKISKRVSDRDVACPRYCLICNEQKNYITNTENSMKKFSDTSKNRIRISGECYNIRIMSADDTVLLGSNEEELHNSLH